MTEITKELLFDLYWKQQLDMKQISNMLGVSVDVVSSRMKKYDIPKRSKKESQLLSSKRTEIQQALSDRTKKMWQDDEYRKHHTERVQGEKNPYYGKKHTDKIRQKMSNKKQVLNASGWKPHNTNKSIREWIPDINTWTKNMLNNRYGAPNEKEEQLINIILKTQYPFVYNGNGEHLIIDGYAPDFVWIDKKKTIELFGLNFHNPEFYKRCFGKEMPISNNEQFRRDLLKEHSYDLLVIWDYELKNGNEYIINKIQQFVDS